MQPCEEAARNTKLDREIIEVHSGSMGKFLKPTWGKFVIAGIVVPFVNLFIKLEHILAVAGCHPVGLGCPMVNSPLCYNPPCIFFWHALNALFLLLTLLLSYLLSCTIVFFASKLKKQQKNRAR